MENKDPYSILGVSRSAQEKEIKQAYKKLAVKFHPDKNKGDSSAEKKFKEISWAYDLLSDPKKRQAFDQYGPEGYSQMGGASASTEGFGDYFDEIFREMFSGGGSSRQRQQVQRGADLEYSIEISLEEAILGKKVDLTIPRQVSCHSCQGSGAAAGSSPQTCGTCGGLGQVRIQQGIFSIQQTCPSCHGQGKIISNPCRTCYGSGLVDEKSTVSVTIPAGIDTGNKMRVPGYGNSGPNQGPAGDLYIHIQVKDHKLFRREGDNLFIDVPIDFGIAALGGQVEVPTLQGVVTLKIPAGTQSHSRFRLAGKGVPRTPHTRQGDLYCKVIVEVPISLDQRQKDLIEQFTRDKAMDEKKEPMRASWLKSIKDFLGRS